MTIRIKNLNRYQKLILLLLMLMILLFATVYPITIARNGFAFRQVILVPSQEQDATRYTGTLNGEPASFTVYPDQTVFFQHGEISCGPYTLQEDRTAIPESIRANTGAIGVELRCGEEIIFRGAAEVLGGMRFLYNEDGSLADNGVLTITFSTTNDFDRFIDEEGNIREQIEPSPAELLDLMSGPTLTHRGSWSIYFCGVLICIITGISMLYADELFRLKLLFTVSHPEAAEPSGLVLACRSIAWTMLTITALIVFIKGLF